MKITHSYEGMGSQYLQARKGSPRFASFVISHLQTKRVNAPYTILELGIGSGQQTEFIEKELLARGIIQYKIFGYDKSIRLESESLPGQLDILKERIKIGELSNKVIPVHFDFDNRTLPLETESVDLCYLAHVFHHLTHKEHALAEINRIMRRRSRLFILGVALEDLNNHPLNEFFPTKFEYEKKRYPTEFELKEMFNNAGLTYEPPCRIARHNIRPINREFLTNVENTAIDSVLMIIKNEDPSGFQQGLLKIEKEVEKAEKSGEYRTYYSASRLRVFWGIKK